MIGSRPRYEQVVSLGYFCSTALELQRYGFRDASYPFDWNISPIEAVLRLLDSGFEGHMRRESLVRDPVNAKIVRNTSTGIAMYNDFVPESSLDEQYAEVSEKYARRIERLQLAIRQRTLFVRYMVNLEEHRYLEENMAGVMAILRAPNPLNDLVLVSNDDLPPSCGGRRVFTVSVDENDDVARAFLRKNRELSQRMLLLPYPMSRRLRNLYVFRQTLVAAKARAFLQRLGVGQLLKRLGLRA